MTRYGYDANGFLSNVIDSRGLESIAAQFRDDGKAAAVDSQHDKTTYEYGPAGTTVRNASQQAAVMTYHASGLVESATDFAGGVTTLEFDQSLRVQRLSFNGAAVALAEYQDGRLSTLNRVDSYHSHEPQSFYYDSRGRLTRVEEDDGVVARYAYDDFDRVTYAFDPTTGYSGSYGSHGHSASGYSTSPDAGALRRYRFDARGNLSGVSMNDMSFRFRTNRFGMIEHVAWAENSAMDITYADTDRVRALRYDVDSVTFGSEFEYDEGGFRVSGRYDVLRSLGDTDVAFDYDSTGNLIRLEMPGPEGTRRVMRHTIGSENQLLLLTPVGNEVFEQAIEYDRNGRAVRSLQGDREAAFAYDELGRLTDVYLDREHVLTASHGPMDLDPVHAADDYSASTPTGEPVASAVFGSLDEIVYTRAFGTPYGIVRFIPEMARFIIPEHPVVPPDSVLLASLRRRNLASEGTLNPSPLLGFDKPSSSLFVPPEFFTSNCAGCAGGTTGFDIDRVGSGDIATGQTITFQASATPYLSYCIYWYMSGYDIVQIPHSFVHNVSFLGGGGSGGGTYYTATPDTGFSGSYSTPGAKTVQDTLTCGCGGIFMAQAQTTVQVIGPTPTGASVTTSAGVVGYIDRNLNMPTVQFSASVAPSSIPVADTTFHWYLEMAYTEHGKNFVHRVPASGTVNITGSNTWQPSWGSLLAGGNEITVYVSATANGGTSPASGKSGFEIHGENPSQAQLFAQANFVEARAVMWQESTHRQFNAVRYTGIDLPLWGTPDGWGLMQRDPLQSEAQLWNWQVALSLGISWLNTVRTNAQDYLNTWYDVAAASPTPADDWSWNPHSQNAAWVWDDAFARYNTGSTTYSVNGNQGVRNCAANGAGCVYADTVRAHINSAPW